MAAITEMEAFADRSYRGEKQFASSSSSSKKKSGKERKAAAGGEDGGRGGGRGRGRGVGGDGGSSKREREVLLFEIDKSGWLLTRRRFEKVVDRAKNRSVSLPLSNARTLALCKHAFNPLNAISLYTSAANQ